MNESSKPTRDDVAKAAGVSTATVSRCLNEPDIVVPATRAKVLRAVEELGYTPDFGGRALASRRTNTVGAVIPTMENAIFARGLQAFQETLSNAGITMLVASSGYDPKQEFEQIRALIGRGADGLLLIGSARPRSTYDFLRQRGIPYVLTWNLGRRKERYVGFDNVKAAAAITQAVIDQGHRNIAMIAGITSMNDRAADRVRGVKKALRKAELEVPLALVEAAYSFDAGSAAFDVLVQQNPRPSAVICGNDVLAVGALKRAQSLNLRVPEDISITGFDDIDIAEYVDPPLTTVHVPHRRMGTAAAEMLMKLIAEEETAVRFAIDFEIAVRGSLGPAPN